MHPWWECRTQLGQVRPPLACSMRHSKVALHAHIANNVGICWQLPAVVPYKRCSQVGAIFQGNVFQQTTTVVSTVECRSLALITQKTACFACAWGSFSLWLTANGCCCCCCVPFASNCWVGVGRRTLREPRLVGMQCRKRNIRCGHHHLVPSLSIRTVGGSACCNCCKQ